MRSRLPILLCAGAAVALAAPSAAQAIDYCVPTTAACPGGVGTAQATFQAALDLADNTNALDRVYLSAGTYTAPTTAGFSYTLGSGPLEVHGKASSGAQQTVLTAPAGATQVLMLKGAAGSALDHLAVAIPDDAATGSFQLRLGQAAASDVAVTSSATQSHTYTGVELSVGSSLADSSVSVSSTFHGTAVLVQGDGVTVARDTLVGYSGLVAGANAAADRLGVLVSTGSAVEVDGATLNVTNSLLVSGVTGNNCAMLVLDQPATDGVLNADGVTVVGTSGNGTGVCADSIDAAPRQATLNLSNSIVRGFGHDRAAYALNTGLATLNAGYSDFDPALDHVVGIGTMNPAAGTLGATNVTVDPQFVGGGNYALSAGSPVRDIGDPAASGGLDLVGAPRLCGRRDLGAYEFAGGASCAAVVVPFPGGGGGGGGGGTAGGAPSGTPDAPPEIPGTPPTPPLPPRADTTAPVLSALGLSHRAFRLARGTRVRFALSEPAAVTVLLQQRGRHGYRTRARLRRDAHAGANAVTVRGLIGQVALKPGRYRARISATDAAGNAATPQTIAFRVLAP